VKFELIQAGSIEITGDTFLNQTYFEEWQPHGSSWDQQRIYEHMQYARETADVIVPGHGPPFRIR